MKPAAVVASSVQGPPAAAPDPVVGIEEVAALLGVGVRSIERALSFGTFPIKPLPSIGLGKIRRRRQWARVEVLRWIDRNGRK